jgi:hypothetical protein
VDSRIQVALCYAFLVGSYIVMAQWGHRLPRFYSDTWKQGRLEIMIALLPFVLLALFMTARMCWDFAYPQKWDDAADDPHVYSWFVAMLWVVLVWGLVGVWRHETRLGRAARVCRLLTHAEKMIRENRLDEAGACLHEAKVLTNYKHR